MKKPRELSWKLVVATWVVVAAVAGACAYAFGMWMGVRL